MDSLRQRVSTKTSRHDRFESLTRPGERYQPRRNHDLYLLCLVAALLVVTLIVRYSYHYLPEPNSATHGNEFSSGNARKHLEAITDLGVRLAGTENNEVRAKNVILRAVEGIQAEASPGVNIEVSVQHPSGHFFLQFLGGMTHLYHNVTNIVVRLSRAGSDPTHALLVNAHFDSAIGSPAASDDAVSCATMLEIIRCLSSPPSPSLLKHAVIFLFNGAEENILPASHGFITQHPWAKKIRAFINLEAAGAGGKELVFQTGPGNPWLAEAYARVAPHPFASVFAQEVFQSGVIPGDTDFRIFRDHGHIPGIDMVYFSNGYVYHTEYDTVNRIPSGSIQRAGENVLALIQELANSPLLLNHGDNKQGKVTYFDFLGMFVVVYPERMGVVLNVLTMLLTVATVWKEARRSGGVMLVARSIVVVILSILASFATSAGTALLVHLSGQTLSWYTSSWLLVPLYYTPSLLGMAAIHLWWKRAHPALSRDQIENVCFHAIQIMWTVMMGLATYFRICSSFLPLVLVLPPVLARNLLWDRVLEPFLLVRRQLFPYLSCRLFLYMMGLLLPFALCMTLALSLHDLLVPLMGRTGDKLPCDVVISATCSFLFCVNFLYPAISAVYLASSRLSKVVGMVLCLTWLVALVAVMCGLFFPYSGGDNPRPKRFFLQHVQKTFHNFGGSVRSSESCIELYAIDFRGIEPIANVVPALQKVQPMTCEGVYCSSPMYLPVLHMLGNSWQIPIPPPLVEPGKLVLLSVEKITNNRRNFTFKATLPNLGRLYVEPRPGYTLSSWSLEDFVPPLTPYGDKQGCYYVYYTRGTGEWAEIEFWLEVEGSKLATNLRESLDISVVTVHPEVPHSSIPELKSLLSLLPDWVTSITLTMTLDNWIF